MSRFSSGGLTTAGSTTNPIGSLYSSANYGVFLREVGIFNTTDTAVALVLKRISTAGTRPSAWTAAKHDPDGAAPNGLAYGTHTSTGPTLTDDLGFRTVLGAAKGSGVIWTFGERGIEIEAGTANGIGIVVENGTGQACQVYFCWDE